MIDESGRVLAAHQAGSAYYLETGLPLIAARGVSMNSPGSWRSDWRYRSK